MEVWPNRSRAFMAGLIGAAANVGYLLVGVVGLGLAAVLASMHSWLSAIGLPESWVETLVSHQGWRLMMILGTVPALLTFFIRLCVPESARWEEERARGATSSWATRDLLAVVVGILGPAAMIYLWARENPLWLRVAGSIAGLALVTVGYVYPVLRYLQRQSATGADKEDWRPTIYRMLLAACLGGVALLGTWGSTQQAPAWVDKMTSEQVKSGKITAAEKPPAKEWTQIWLACGAIVGTIGAALVGDWLGRRITYCLLCVLSLASVFVLFQNKEFGQWFLTTAFIAGTFTAAFYGWLPLYLPELFRTRVRATGQGFGFNFGRILAAVGVLQLGNLVGVFGNGLSVGSIEVAPGLPTACTVLSLVYVVGMVIIWLAPETKGQPLPD
jgi:MFS family permease